MRIGANAQRGLLDDGRRLRDGVDLDEVDVRLMGRRRSSGYADKSDQQTIFLTRLFDVGTVRLARLLTSCVGSQAASPSNGDCR
jgi:hypothetical protein